MKKKENHLKETPIFAGIFNLLQYLSSTITIDVFQVDDRKDSHFLQI